ncbi:MAG: 3'-5' exonuclease [Treponema sp.]|uniref:3'-5' exonuclease n=1 Tax=Treponema sp. TaxID=166 RepID=UPI0025F9F658|nr:3'-5' exonuclease [Treponema sp.]MBQ8680910.1 3'-5' exonuclease [Treponema sp.]
MPKSHLHLLNDYRRMNRLLQNGAVFCALDTETTGLKPAEERIIEIGAVKFDKNGELGRFSTLVNPRILIPHFCQELTGITNKMVFGQKEFKEIADDLLSFLDESIIIAHNAQFDLRFVNAELERINHDSLLNKAIDTLRFSRWAYPDNEHWTLQFLAEQLKIEVKAAHRAEDDARVCMELFLHCIKDTMDRQKEIIL